MTELYGSVKTQLLSGITIFILVFLGGCQSTGKDKVNNSFPATSYDGMELIQQSKTGYLYQKTGLDMSKYNQIILLPSQVAFKKDWKRDYNQNKKMLSTRVRDKDLERIKGQVATLFDGIFNAELSNLKFFSLTTSASKQTVTIRPAIINLDAYAPDLKSASTSRTYAERAGEGTLYLEMYDSVSGEILARAIDRRATRDNYYHWANKVSNQSDAKALLRTWAKILLTKLDEVGEQ